MDVPLDRPGKRTRARPEADIDALKPADIAACWRDAAEMLRTVFGRTDAKLPVDEARGRLDAAPAATRSICYPASPLDTAADLAGIDGPLTVAQVSNAVAIQGVGLARA
jgi:hypothetical protein